jgi:outer membrane protein assembly factor BamB
VLAAPATGPAHGGQPEIEGWRPFRITWRADLSRNERRPLSLDDCYWEGGRVYFVNEAQVGCLDARSGETLWQQPLLPAGESPARAANRRLWRLTVSAGRVILVPSNTLDRRPPPPHRVLAFDKQSGEEVWSREMPQRPVGPAALLDRGLLVVGAQDGTLLALRERDGVIAWQRRLAQLPPDRSNQPPPPVVVRGAGPYGVAQLRTGELVGFRVSDGEELWRAAGAAELHHPSHTGGFFAVSDESRADGVVYSLLGRQFVALRLPTGEPLWTREVEVTAMGLPELRLAGEQLLLTGEQLLRLDRRTGRTASRAETPEHHWLLHALGEPDGLLLLRTPALPWIAGEQREALTVSELDTLVAFDSAGRKVAWRWQPHEGDRISARLPLVFLPDEGDRLLFSDGFRLIAAAPGPPDALPADREARRQLAHELAPGDAVAAAIRFDQLPYHSDPQWAAQILPRRLTLLRLGAALRG